MALSYIGNSAYSAQTLTISLNGLASGSAVASSTFACPSAGSGEYYDTCDVRVNLGAATTLGTTAPVQLIGKVIAARDGTNLEYWTASGGLILPTNYSSPITVPNTGVSAQYLDIPGLSAFPGTIAVVILNGLGVALPASGVTATAYFYMSATG